MATNVRRAVRKYIEQEWRVVPVPQREKSPRLRNWQKQRLDETDVPNYFGEDQNVGILLGEPSNGLIDIDLDCELAISLAPVFLPKTDRVHGRKSKPTSHYWFRMDSAPKPQKFCDPDGTCLLEIRSTGQQTIVPPSLHPSGERIKWERSGEPAQVRGAALLVAVQRLTAASLLARHWPTVGRRHDATLALSGMLLRAGWHEDEVIEFVSSVAQAAGDEEWAARAADAQTTRARLESEQETTGRPRLTEIMGAPIVDHACKWLGIGRTAEQCSNSHRAIASWPKRLGKRAYYGLAGEFVRAVEPVTEADPAGLLIQFITAFGNAAGRNGHFRVGAAEHRANLFCVLVGRTAKARKGTAWAEIEHLFENTDRVWSGRCVLPGGLASGEGLIWAVRDRIEKPGKPTKIGCKSEAPPVIVDEGVEDKRLLVIEQEFASPLRIMRRETNILSPVIRRAWDKGNLSTVSKNSPARATGAHISIIGHITRDELLRELNTAEGSNGFANRFLWCCVRRSKCLPLGGQLEAGAFRLFVGRLQARLAFARKARELRFSPVAERLWCRIYPKLSAEAPGLLGAITSRAEAQVLRLSLIYALLDRSRTIKKQHLKAALAVWCYSERSARYIFGDKSGNLVADTILRRLRATPKGLTRNDIREIFSHNRSEGEISGALATLQEHGLARCVREETGGRPTERWFAEK
jgi:Bifunctional DNA primase/polymerase, N-terminal